MKGERPLFWHQGLFLQPQHFQQLDAFHSSLWTPFQEYAQPFFWGVIRLQVQEDNLPNKEFEVSGGEFLFPDGTHVVFPGNAVLKSRSFDGAWARGEKPFQVFLGLKKWNPAAENATVVDDEAMLSSATTRFATLSHPESVVDLHSKGPAAPVKRLTYVLQLFWETEREFMDSYSVLPIARLVRTGDEIRIGKRYVPPLVHLAASPMLMKIFKDLRDQVASRSSQLEEYKDTKELQPMQLALCVLNRYVPLLTHLVETPHIHPWGAYSVLRQLVGELSTFSPDVNALGERKDGTRPLPAYDHTDAGDCFTKSLDLIGELLNAILAGPEYSVRLKHDGHYWSGTIPQKALNRHFHYWLIIQSQAEPKAVVSAVRQVAKLATTNNLTQLIARALPGIPLGHHPGTPPGLPQRPNTHYFQIDISNRLWAEVEKIEGISLFWNNAPEDLQAEVIVIGE